MPTKTYLDETVVPLVLEGMNLLAKKRSSGLLPFCSRTRTTKKISKKQKKLKTRRRRLFPAKSDFFCRKKLKSRLYFFLLSKFKNVFFYKKNHVEVILVSKVRL